ncbi:NAD(P)/FAD-dependent oxidoreductase [Alienimonas californiensis]|uniref:NADH:ubiquinone reductase (non-electrogenic) n=1 Tax=Alienimonas californiensis TaxID=2527989 RepID=A0A517PAM9_9PLAN|nr:NAD(P)/FAD-dependent oxidoreductase [Alienimonas californiensis]QDT16430.1 NADH dehydrogenase-like protein [Alienimonas californiensis]
MAPPQADTAVPVTLNGRGPVPLTHSPEGRHRVVVIGGGFAGMNVVRGLRKADVDVTLIDRRNHHLFQPLLYQVATGSLSPANIAAPLRGMFDRQSNTTVLLGEAVGFDMDRRVVQLCGKNNPTTAGGPEDEIPYDTLIVASGSTHSYFGRDEWAPYAPGLKTIEDAIEIRRRILLAFEEAEREPDPDQRAAWMTFVLVGGGPTGVELAGSIAEIARNTLKNDFRRIDPSDARIVIADGGPRVLSSYDEELSRYAARDLREMGVEIITDTRVTDVTATEVTLSPEDRSPSYTLQARTVVWCAGVRASRLGKRLAAATGCPADREGRVKVERNLTVPGRPEIFVLGDLAHFDHAPEDSKGGWSEQGGGKGTTPLPGVAQVAMQQGKHTAKTLRRRLRGLPDESFEYTDLGTMAVIGRGAAVADLFGRYHATGGFAWLMWLAIHVMYIVGYQSRLLVMIQWAYHYVTMDRGARLITGQTLPVSFPAETKEDGENPLTARLNAAPPQPDPHGVSDATEAAERVLEATLPAATRTPAPAGSAAVGAQR